MKKPYHFIVFEIGNNSHDPRQVLGSDNVHRIDRRKSLATINMEACTYIRESNRTRKTNLMWYAFYWGPGYTERPTFPISVHRDVETRAVNGGFATVYTDNGFPVNPY